MGTGALEAGGKERGVMGEVWKLFRRDRPAVVAAAIIVLFVASAVLAPLIVPYDPHEQFFDGLTMEGAPLPPTTQYWLGTDLLGRDLLSRLIYGALRM